MQDEFDADGYEPEHDQYLDNDDELSSLFEDEDEFDDRPEEDCEQDDPDLDDPDDELDIWDDL